MPEDDLPVRITRITLRPRITVGPEANVDRVYRLVEKAHERVLHREHAQRGDADRAGGRRRRGYLSPAANRDRAVSPSSLPPPVISENASR